MKTLKKQTMGVLRIPNSPSGGEKHGRRLGRRRNR
jgi:hypothetical protein